MCAKSRETVSMNRTLRNSLFFVGLFILGASISVTEIRAQNVLGEILRRMDAQNKAISSLQANLAMVKYDSALKEEDPPLIGTTMYLPKSKQTKNKLFARVDWKNPDEQISITGDTYTIYTPRLQRVITGNVQKAKGGSKVGNVLGFMTMSRAELNANYSTTYLGQEKLSDGTLTWHLQLTPTTATSYKLAELWVDGNGMPRQTKVTERNNDWTTLLLTNIQKNIKIDTKVFKLIYPSSLVPLPG